VSIDIRAPHALEVCCDTFMSTMMMHGSYLGADEFDVLPTRDNYRQITVPYTSSPSLPLTPTRYSSVLAVIAPRLSFYYAGRVADTWAPMSQYDTLKKELPGSRFTIVKELAHAWPAYINECQTLARLCANEVITQIWNQAATNMTTTIDGTHPPRIPSSVSSITVQRPSTTPSASSASPVSRL
jgi:hypothetical protein